MRRPYHTNYCRRCCVMYIDYKARVDEAYKYAAYIGALSAGGWLIRYRSKHGPAGEWALWNRPEEYET